ncbi:MAG: aldose epimerase family protein [Mangrovibacterium sp.]
MNIFKNTFGIAPSGEEVSLFTLQNGNITVKITNYGCIITSIETPNRKGEMQNIVCGFEKFEDYISNAYLQSYPYFGCILGRCANRIAKGKYVIDGVQYSGVVNNGENHLHGGADGFDKKVFSAEPFEKNGVVGLKLKYTSVDGEEGYPGELTLTCIYELDSDGKLCMSYEAETNKKTILNISNHSYFNLTAGAEDILNHELELTAKNFTESVEMIPTGRILSVKGTPFDFTTKKTLGKDIATLADGYDLNMVLDNENSKLVYAGCLSEQTSGRKVEVLTTQPGMQVYTGFWIPELEIAGKKKFGKFSGIALETQHYPDSANHENFPTVILNPGEKFKETTIYQFGMLDA